MIGNIQEAKARGGSGHRADDRGQRAQGSARSGARLPDHGADRTSAADAGADGRAAAAARLSHRRPPRLRRRSAAQSGEERHGRMVPESVEVEIPAARGSDPAAAAPSRPSAAVPPSPVVPTGAHRRSRSAVRNPRQQRARSRLDRRGFVLEPEPVPSSIAADAIGADRVRDVAAGDVGRGPVHRLEEARPRRRGSPTAAGRAIRRCPPASSDRMSPNMFSVRITSKRRGRERELHRAGVDEHVVERDVGILAATSVTTAATAATSRARSPCPPTSRAGAAARGVERARAQSARSRARE